MTRHLSRFGALVLAGAVALSLGMPASRQRPADAACRGRRWRSIGRRRLRRRGEGVPRSMPAPRGGSDSGGGRRPPPRARRPLRRRLRRRIGDRAHPSNPRRQATRNGPRARLVPREGRPPVGRAVATLRGVARRTSSSAEAERPYYYPGYYPGYYPWGYGGSASASTTGGTTRGTTGPGMVRSGGTTAAVTTAAVTAATTTARFA